MKEEDVRIFYDRDGRPIELGKDRGSMTDMDNKDVYSFIQMAARSGKPLESFLQGLALKEEDISTILQYAQKKGFISKKGKVADTHKFQNDQTKSNKISKNLRILILLSIIWLFIFFLIAIGKAGGDYESRRLITFTMIFFGPGVLPIVVLWGIIWIRAAAK
jgi:hypothetical protein